MVREKEREELLSSIGMVKKSVERSFILKKSGGIETVDSSIMSI